MGCSPENLPTDGLTRRHHQRLREIYRSAGWPCQDMLEVELLAGGLLQRVHTVSGHETLRVTDAGVTRLAQVLAQNKAKRSAHETLVENVAREMARAGRVVWRGLSLRVQPSLPTAEPDSAQSASWRIACPDVFSIRNTSIEAYLEPIVHEIKVSRADLLGDLKKPDKRAAYLALGGECWYVLGQTAKGKPIADADEVPSECGVMLCKSDRLVVARPAPRSERGKLPFHVWMCLSKATPLVQDDACQVQL
ncbi:MAG: hypothetical protein ABI343_12145 [Burkholderiaceae bacterium]